MDHVSETIEQQGMKPTRKVGTVGVAASVTTLIVFIAGRFDLVIPPDAAAAITTLVGFTAGYFARESAPAAKGTTYAGERGQANVNLLIQVLAFVILGVFAVWLIRELLHG
jgi:hypothetical protein